MSGLNILLLIILALVALYSAYRSIQRFRDHYNEILVDSHRLAMAEDRVEHLERRIFAYETRESIQEM